MNKDNVYYFIGIKGSGMSALALILHDQGYQVAGSDIDQYTFTQKPLEQAGIPIYSFDANNIKPGMVVIRGNSFEDDQVEVAAALEHQDGVIVVSYPEMVEALITQYTSIGVAGAHGKTSTTGLLAHVLSRIAPTSYLIGDGTGKGIPDARFFVFEADEYRRHFKDYTPDYSIMTNVDFDHPDYYTGIEDVFQAFNDFGQHVKKGIFAWGDDPNLRQLIVDVPVYYYGIDSDDDFVAKNIKRSTNGSSFDAYYHDELLGNFQVPLFGKHGILNSLAVIAVAYFEQIDLDLLRKELMSFQGVKRRFTEKTVGDVTIIDDYAHHPSEITATLDAARQKFPDRELIAVFQPHTFTRTIAYLDDFASSLNLADRVYLTEIFASARETVGDISSSDLGAKMTKFGGIVSPENVAPLMTHDSNPVVVFMGAGDVQNTEFAYEKILANTTMNLQ
ncbi:UDP-N-acetylmuramate--L-alanine ligase [Weissella diestrammenae]|uniref:UDP-N-acetylmuramate--L-alanine ligase n=1 Tax=Weissella diestrammenae TaxID=1162633 RepID=A0A7G9T5K5_9LACO|nr:UDP-N-acetylmuramate--L-alanine ligase [Weissella diestrammenae]MCM0582207.1 UDP-N-acetylmuramate--L-alanine ligase [Weissella diestrammenae]QNN75380.1 UDP-N-acetylmuramate--L-alanine ligase [Weissella diestrammenae]